MLCFSSVYAFKDLAPLTQTAPQLDRDMTAISCRCAAVKLSDASSHEHLRNVCVFQDSFSVGTTVQCQQNPLNFPLIHNYKGCIFPFETRISYTNKA